MRKLNLSNHSFTKAKLKRSLSKILVLAVYCVSSFIFGQTNRFLYDLVINKNGETVKAVMALDIDQKEVKFYDYEFVKQDSLRKSTGRNLQCFSETDQMLTRNVNSSTNISYTSFYYDYFKITTQDDMVWKLDKATKKVENYTLQKATTDFGGRSWTAWFTTEIPFQEGPYKFRGLSGLIFEVYDSENIFHYKLTRSEKLSKTFDTSDFLETHYGKAAMPITLKQYHKLKLDYYYNIVQVLNDFTEKGGSVTSEKDLNSKEDILKEKRDLQRSIRSNYLPIEKDRAIPYPAD